MGKKIDFFVLTAGITVVVYFFFYGVFQNTYLSAALSLLFCILFTRLIRKSIEVCKNSSFARKRRIYRATRGIMMKLACMDYGDAHSMLSRLLKDAYGDDFAIVLIQNYPGTALKPSEIFSVWKENRAAEKLCICATSHSDSDCRTLVGELKQPRVALIDAGALSQLIAEHPQFLPPEEKRMHSRLMLSRLKNLLINRRNAPRCLWMCFSLMILYVMTANIFYLAGSLFLALIAFLSFQRQKQPVKLF